ncbi:MAG: DNA adenine methylase [Zoogloeaceae bacterium]|jgi:DNA adenine methylase|nr:DNA adenine methylase [Zoogloeaceae bacterium]
MEINKSVTRSALRYFGGKWAIAPWIIEHMPKHRVYVEPFGGAASVLLRKPRSKIEVYNDLDDEIVGLFRILQSPAQCQRLVRLLKRTPYARREFEIAFQSTDDPLIRAQRAIIRAYMSFHHTALFNSGKNTFADARHRHGGHSKSSEWSTYPRHLVSVCRRLAGALIENRPAQDVIRVQDTHDALFFVDPPYVHSTRDQGARYRCEMNDAEHVQLLAQLAAVQGRVMITGYASDLYDDLLTDWQRLTRKHYAAASGPVSRTEVLWIRP